MLKEKQFDIAGWIAVLSAIMLPIFILGSLLSAMASTLFAVLLSVAEVFIFLIFKNLLNEKAQFHDADGPIVVFVWITIAWMISLVLYFLFGDVDGFSYAVVNLSFGICAGTLLVVMGIKILKCKLNFYQHLKMFAWLLIICGPATALVSFLLLLIAYATMEWTQLVIGVVVLVFFGAFVIIWVAIYIIFARMFFKSAQST